LIEKRARFLPAPRCREVSHAVFADFDFVGNGAVQEFDVGGESFLDAE